MSEFSSDTLIINKGSAVTLQVNFGINLSNVTLSTFDAKNQALNEPDISITDMQDGIAQVSWTDEQIETLNYMGRLDWFRFKLTYDNGNEINSNKVWVEIR